MKKIVLLSAFMLMSSSIISCDNDQDLGGNQSFATDDGFTPIKPPPPPPPTVPGGGGIVKP